jgi:hypothetical protein
VTGQWFSPGPLVSSTNKTDSHDITETLLKVALNKTDSHDIAETLLKVALNKTDSHDITETLLKVALNTITLNYVHVVVFMCSVI